MFYEEIQKNKIKSWLLVCSFFAIIGVLSYVILYYTYFGESAIIFAFLIAVISSYLTYYYSDSLVLTFSRARPVKKIEYPFLYNITEGLAIAAGIPKPRLFIIDDDALNAFATGRDPEHSVIVVTKGLIKKLNREELEGVIGHEMSHIKNYDIKFATLVVVLVGMVAILSRFFIRSQFWGNKKEKEGASILFFIGLILAIFAPLFTKLVQLAISRKREFLADASSVELTRNPSGLINALKKISENPGVKSASQVTAGLFISNPFRKQNLIKLFSTHPPIEERIKALEKMA